MLSTDAAQIVQSSEHRHGALRWLTAARPKTLPASIAPVLLAAALSLENRSATVVTYVATLIAAVLIQILTNFANDLYDYLKGADTASRIGPLRVTQARLVSPNEMRIAIVVTLILALGFGAYLVAIGGVPILVIGVLSLVFALLYTAGPWPLAYLGIGELFVLIFFGPVAVGGAFYLFTGELSSTALWIGLTVGMLSTTILVVNNLRDRATDAIANKLTTAVRFGATFSRIQYSVLTIAALFIAAAIAITTSHYGALLSLICIYPALKNIREVWSRSEHELNPLLERSGRLVAGFSLTFAVGWCL